ncbi:MAG: hypothetical protein K9N49_00825 [Candidatus Marinimicrobia bacterium]|nr:hypothetical protein [Candidatus Neomarinimicrobiota bacterium]
MDAPEDFAEEAELEEAGAPGGAGRPRRGGGRWFALGLAFLLVNAYGVWRWAPQPGHTTPGAEVLAPPAPPAEALRLEQVAQVNLGHVREVTLRLEFNVPPDAAQLPRFLTLTEEGGQEVAFQLLGESAGEHVLIETEPVMSDQLKYHLGVGLPAGAGQAASPSAREQSGKTGLSRAMRFLKCTAESASFGSDQLDIMFTATPQADGLEEYIALDPPVAYSIHYTGAGRARLRGDFKPGGVYTVTLREGLPAENGAPLLAAVTRTIQFPDRPAGLHVDAVGRYLAPTGRLALPLITVNLEAYEATLYPVLANNLAQLVLRDTEHMYGYYGYDRVVQHLHARAVTHTNLVTAAPNERARTVLHLRDLAGANPRGVYWLDLGGKHIPSQGRLVVISDLGLTARVHASGMLVWVNSLLAAEPLEGVEVAVYARSNEELARGVTDARGCVQFDDFDNEEPFLVVARRGDDLSYIDLRRTRVNQGPGLEGREYLAAGATEAAVYTERGVYRPGETVMIEALARNDQLEAPGEFPVVFRVRRPDGRVFRDLPVTLDPYGAARATVELPAYLPTGRDTLELALPGTFTVLGETTIALEDFVPPQIRVTIDAPPERAPAGAPSAFGVWSEHLFGRPAAGLPVEGHVTIKPVPFAPAAWTGWTFGDPERTFAPVQRPLGRQVLDDEGRARFTVETHAAWRPAAALQVVCQATVQEASGRAVTGYGSAALDAYPFYIGLRPAARGALRVGDPQRVSVVEVAPDGTPYDAAKPLQLTLARITWNSVLRRNSDGRYEWKSERKQSVIREDTLAGTGAPADWTFSLDAPGEYTLLARDPASGAATRLTLYAADPEQRWVAWSREEPGRVELAWDRAHYAPGDVARLQVRAPFSGMALLTIETDRVRAAQIVRLEKNTAELEVSVDATYAPNVYCTVTVIRPVSAETVGSPHRALGAIALPVVRPGRALQVEIAAPAVLRPQSRLAATVTVRDEDGQPVTGAATLMAVDEGICLLTAFAAPDPNQLFRAQRRLGVMAFDLYQELLPLVDEQVAVVSAAGGDMESLLRRRLNPIRAQRFRPVALWQAGVELDAQGQATVALDVPEFSGTLRLMAVAYNARQIGTAQSQVQVKRDVVAQVALPRFLAIGDRAEALVTLHNESPIERAVQVRMTVGGPLQNAQPDQTVALAAGASAHVPFTLTAGPGSGTARCVVEIEAGPDSSREVIELAVRPAAGTRIQTENRVVQAGDEIRLDPPPDWLPASISQAGALSALPALRWARALEYVMYYPYGCLEQTVSGAFPLLYAAHWPLPPRPGQTAVGDLSERVPPAILRALSMQRANGGFAYWPFAREVESEASLYATHFLVEARAAGFPVPADRLESALGWLRQRLQHNPPIVVGEAPWLADMSERAYACHILARAGTPDVGWNARLREQFDRLYYDGQIHTVAALLLAGEPRQAVERLHRLPMPQPRPRLPGVILNSDVREAALLLSAWLDADPRAEQVFHLARYLQDRQHNGHWGNTQDNAMALLALGKFEQHAAATRQPFTAELTRAEGHRQTIADTDEETRWAVEAAAVGPVIVKNHGPGALYLMVRHEGVGREPEPAGDAGVAIRREFLDRQGQSLDPETLVQGDMVVVRLTLDSLGRSLDQMVIEDLLPAGWEIENPKLATSQQFNWVPKQLLPTRHQDIRDDRLLVFTGSFHGRYAFYYAVRAVTPGTYAHPPVTVSDMYDPDIRSVHGGGIVEVTTP